MIGTLGQRKGSGDELTLYPDAEHVDGGVVKAVTFCFGCCSVIWLALFYLVLSLSVLPNIGHEEWQVVRCRAVEARRSDSPSEFCPQGRRGMNGGIRCDAEPDPLRPSPGGLWGDRCHDTAAAGPELGSCVRHIWVNVLLEWERPADQHHKVDERIDRMADRLETVGTHIQDSIDEKLQKRHPPSDGFEANDINVTMQTRKYLSVCFPYRCDQDFQLEAEDRADELIGRLVNRSTVAIPLGGPHSPNEDGAKSNDWGDTLCHYSRSFYSELPNIQHRHTASAVYLRKPTGYVDLPGGVTFASFALALLTGGCALLQACCLFWQCRTYVVGKGAKQRSRHVL